jgi:hypothetical protein
MNLYVFVCGDPDPCGACCVFGITMDISDNYPSLNALPVNMCEIHHQVACLIRGLTLFAPLYRSPAGLPQ